MKNKTARALRCRCDVNEVEEKGKELAPQFLSGRIDILLRLPSYLGFAENTIYAPL